MKMRAALNLPARVGGDDVARGPTPLVSYGLVNNEGEEACRRELSAG